MKLLQKIKLIPTTLVISMIFAAACGQNPHTKQKFLEGDKHSDKFEEQVRELRQFKIR